MTTRLYSYNKNFPAPLPHRIRLSNGITRTDSSTFTLEEIADAGYVLAETIPNSNPVTQRLAWNGVAWEVTGLTAEESATILAAEIQNIRQKRDVLINAVAWRIQRYESETRLGLPSTDDIQKLDEYIQALRDVTEQPDILNIEWPILT
jgi:hypothetical protein